MHLYRQREGKMLLTSDEVVQATIRENTERPITLPPLPRSQALR